MYKIALEKEEENNRTVVRLDVVQVGFSLSGLLKNRKGLIRRQRI